MIEFQHELKDLADARDVTDEAEMHISARTYLLFQKYKDQIEEGMPDFLSDDCTEIVESEVEECRGAGLPNFVSTPCLFALASPSVFYPP